MLRSVVPRGFTNFAPVTWHRGQPCVGRWPADRRKLRSSSEKDVSKSLESLEALLPPEGSQGADVDPTRPARAARNASRRTSMSPDGVHGRFIGLDNLMPQSTSIGQQTEVGASNALLPTTDPIFNQVFAAATAIFSISLVLFPSIFTAEDNVMYTELAAEGSLRQVHQSHVDLELGCLAAAVRDLYATWTLCGCRRVPPHAGHAACLDLEHLPMLYMLQFLTASFLSPTLPNCGLGVALLLTVGGLVEQTLGPMRFASIYVLAGITTNVAYFAMSDMLDPGAYHCGTAGGLVGVCTALVAVVLRNTKVMTRAQQVQLQLAAAAAAAAAVAGDALLWGDHTFIPGCYAAAAAAGAALGWGMAPRYVVLREVVIPDGSVEVPEDAPEVQIVLDQASGVQRWGVCLGYGLLLGLVTLGLSAAAGGVLAQAEAELLVALEENPQQVLEPLLRDPQASLGLQELMGNDWPLQL